MYQELSLPYGLDQIEHYARSVNSVCRLSSADINMISGAYNLAAATITYIDTDIKYCSDVIASGNYNNSATQILSNSAHKFNVSAYTHNMRKMK